MKKLLILTASVFLCIAAVVAISAQVQKQEASGIKWLTDMETALQRAKSENKPILLEFFNPN
jgi:hypothetical protein